MSRRGRAVATVAAALALQLLPARAAHTAPVVIDRTVVRFVAPETGGVRAPRFILARELAFEARLEALAEPDQVELGERPYLERHLRAALERHIAETLLASSRIDPPPTDAELAVVTRAARARLRERAGGAAALRDLLAVEGLGESVVEGIAARQARASLYIDRMVAPMLEPSETELRASHRQSQYRALPFEKARPMVHRAVVGQRLGAAVTAHFQAARTRLSITVLASADR